MTLVEHHRMMARNNAWSNLRLSDALHRLAPGEFEARRTSFFPSLKATLNHILTVDWYYIDAIAGGGRGLACFDPEEPCDTVAAWWAAQQASDARLVAICDGLDEAGLARIAVIDRGPKGPDPEPVSAILSHLVLHQIHHRGQVHAMMSGTSVKPPQLDEFVLASDAPLRADELRRLGFREHAGGTA